MKVLRRLRALLPVPWLRRALWNAAIAVRVGKAPARPRPGPPLVAGFLGTASGLGQAARMTFGAFEALGLEPAGMDISPWFGKADLPLRSWPKPRGQGGTLVLQVNPPETARALAILGRGVTASRRLVGYWAWELPVFPPGWDHCQHLLHEVWVPSRFVAEALAPCGLPVRVVPHPLLPRAPAAPDRARFQLEDDAFVVLVAFDMRSSFSRKNPLAAIRAFRQGLAGRAGARLVLKVGNGAEFPKQMEALRREAGGDPRIRIVTEVLDGEAMAGLLAAADVVLSLHRAEGFGLVLAEAMACGKPVVATAWSGNLDFMTDADSCLVPADLVAVDDPDGIYGASGALWAEPSVEAAAEWLGRLHDCPELRVQLGERARMAVQRVLGHDAWKMAIQSVSPNTGFEI